MFATESGFVEHMAATVDHSPYLSNGPREELRVVMGRSNSVRELADATYHALHRSWFERIAQTESGAGISLRTRDVSVLFDHTAGDLKFLNLAANHRFRLNEATLRAQLSYDHPQADQVLEVTFQDAGQFAALVPVFENQLNSYILLMDVNKTWGPSGIFLNSIAEDESQGIFRIPTLSLFEAGMRCMLGSRFSFCIAAGEVTPNDYRSLWNSNVRPIGLPLEALYLHAAAGLVDPVTFAGHDIYHAIHNFIDTELL